MNEGSITPLPEGSQIGRYRVSNVLEARRFTILYRAMDEQGVDLTIEEFAPWELAQRYPGLDQIEVGGGNKYYRVGYYCFREEWCALSKMDHRNLVRVLDVISANETVYQVRHYEVGRSLGEFISCARDSGSKLERNMRKTVLPEDFVRHVMLQVLDGLEQLHRSRMQHMNLSVHSIFVRTDQSVVLHGIGGARRNLYRALLKDDLRDAGFSSPELYMRDGRASELGDIYSLGACMLDCMAMSGAGLFVTRLLNPEMLLRTLERLYGHYSAPLISLVGRCLSLDQAGRPQSVDEVRRGLAGA